MSKEIIICAAVKSKDGKIIRGHRHGNCMETMRGMRLEYSSEASSQGFMTSKNRFVDRTEGLKLQKAAGIPSADKDGYRYMLFSEDLY